MRIGMTLPTMAPDLGADGVAHWARRVDEGPFATLAVGERINFPNPEIAVTLGAATALTERVRLAATVFVLPLRATAWLAKQAATLDVLSGGRLTVGVGVGGREEDYRTVGASFERRHARMDAQVAELRRLWAGEPPEAGGAPVGPAPVQPGGPPLWIGALSEKPVARGARWADGLAGFDLGPDPASVEQSFRRAERLWREAGRKEAPYRVVSFFYALGPEASERLRAYAQRYLGVFGDRTAAALAGACRAAGADALREALRSLEGAGADEVILVPTSAHPDELERTIDLVG
jgi:alkanesulfonate monooxygenase SsuD/methylene tetrahydromethanopterin reductase-like flavin-dependent oxidoreductase (luciferase family)